MEYEKVLFIKDKDGVVIGMYRHVFEARSIKLYSIVEKSMEEIESMHNNLKPNETKN